MPNFAVQTSWPRTRARADRPAGRAEAVGGPRGVSRPASFVRAGVPLRRGQPGRTILANRLGPAANYRGQTGRTNSEELFPASVEVSRGELGPGQEAAQAVGQRRQLPTTRHRQEVYRNCSHAPSPVGLSGTADTIWKVMMRLAVMVRDMLNSHTSIGHPQPSSLLE